MKYYLDTIEQVRDQSGALTEYGKREKKDSYEAARTAFYDKLKNVSNSSSHVFLDARIVDSTGGVVKKDSIGEYVDEATPVETPEE